jgi:uncharacterized protein
MSAYQQLDPRYITVQRLAGWIMFAVTMAAWAAAMAVVWNVPYLHRSMPLAVTGLGAALAPLLIWLATAWPALSYRHASYRIDDESIEIRTGVYVRRVITVPRSRVQHTDVSQGPIERRYGLGTLVIYTAGTQFAQVTLPGLEYGTAAAIRDRLLPKHGADAV